MKIDRILFTAPQSAGGKTMVTCGILEALSQMGIKTATFKCGPDYIDPMFHRKAIAADAWNLDTFLTSGQTVRALLASHGKKADLAVMEGVMGYYDGLGGTTTKASTYELSRVTDTPAVLIVNAKGMSTSVLAQIHGFLTWKKDSRIKGILLNRISSMLYPRMKELIEENFHIPVAGYVPEVSECVLESRYLGLVMPGEIEDIRTKLRKLAGIMKETIDWDTLFFIAGTAPELKEKLEIQSFRWPQMEKMPPLRIGIARDEAFCFIYEENIELLRAMGAEIVPFSPLRDGHLPEDLDGMIFYGGYPELYGVELEANHTMKAEVAAAASMGLPCMAECGGFLYLHRELEDKDGVSRKMAGVIPGKAYKKNRLSRFGYISLTQKAGSLFGTEPAKLKAHEFHYYDSDCCGKDFAAEKPVGRQSWKCIHASDTLFAGFPHFYYYGSPELPEAFLKKCRQYQMEKRRQNGYLGNLQ